MTSFDGNSVPEAFLIAEFKLLNQSGDYNIGITSDISDEGLSLETQPSGDLKKGALLEIYLKNTESENKVCIQGKVVWTKSSWYKFIMGIKFHGDEDGSREELKKMTSMIKVENKSDTVNEEVRVEESIFKALENSYSDSCSDESIMDNPPEPEGFTNINSNAVKSIDDPGENETGDEQGVNGSFGPDDQTEKTGENRHLPDWLQGSSENQPVKGEELSKRKWPLFLSAAAVVILLMFLLPSLLKFTNRNREPQQRNSASTALGQQENIVASAINYGSSKFNVSAPVVPVLSEEPLSEIRDSSGFSGPHASDDQLNSSAEEPMGSHDGIEVREVSMQKNSDTGLVDAPLTAGVSQSLFEEGAHSLKEPAEGTDSMGLPDKELNKYVVYARTLNIRASASVESSITGKLKRGTVFDVLESHENNEGLWHRMGSGYVFALYTIELIPEQ